MNVPRPGMIIRGPEGEETLRLEEFLGRGAFGEVFKATEVSTGVPYAVKFPAVGAVERGDEMRAFLNEVQAASQVQHPNVVRVVHVEPAPTNLPPYLVMEFIEGGTLRQRLEDYRSSGELVPPQLVRKWTEGLAQGIAAVNDHVIHRDLRPENVLMKGDIPLIADFGISKVVGAITRNKTFKGGQHILYMAPEGWKMERNEIQIDMYSLGIALFEIATLKYPFERAPDPQDIDAVRRMHLFEHPRSLRELRDDLPVGLSHVIARLMEKRPQERFSNWSELAQALNRAWATSEADSAGPSGVVTDLLDETQRVYDVLARQRLEDEKRVAAKEERRRLDLHQMERLMDDLRNAVTQYNEQSSLGIIEVDCHPQRRHCWFELPFASQMSLGFDWIDPPLSLRKGQVRFFGLLKDDDGGGLNYLLCRKDESDLYGKWVACCVTRSPAVHPRHLPARPEPFGLPREEISEIQVAEDAVHIYEVDFTEDVQDAFVHAVLSNMRRQRST